MGNGFGALPEIGRGNRTPRPFLEDLVAYRDLYDTRIEGMDERYQWKGKAYVLCEDGNLFINAASGAVAVDERVKRDLRLYEIAKPRLGDAFRRLRYCDEMWFFTTETLARGWVDYDRTHLSLGKDTSGGRPIQHRPVGKGKIIVLPPIGGLHHRYEWQKAA